jgi:hypothetical protein
MHGITAPISGEGKFSSQPAYIEAIAGSGVKKNPGSGVLCMLLLRQRSGSNAMKSACVP